MEWPVEEFEVNIKPPKRLRIVQNAAETALEGQKKRQGAVDVVGVNMVDVTVTVQTGAACFQRKCFGGGGRILK